MHRCPRKRRDDRPRQKALWRSVTSILLAGSILAQCGCITTGPHQWLQNGFKVGPEYGRPPAPVADQWIQAGDPLVQSTRLENGDWWSVFDDPTLTALIHLAYEQNPNLRSVGARVLQARAGQAISVGNLLPQTQQAQANYARVNLNPNMPVINQLIKALPPGSTPLAFSNWYYGFNLSWELDLWGRLRRSIESSNAQLDASVEDYDAALVTLFADVATNYVQYRVAQQRIKIARDNVRIQEGVLTLAEEKFRVGTTSRLDVEQAKTVLEQTRSFIPAQQIVMGQANDSLCILVGTPPRDLEADLGPGPALGKSPIPNTPAWVAAGIPADLVRRRPDVRSAERLVAAQSAQIGVAEADLYPTLYINGTIGWDAENFSQAFSTKSFFGLLLPGFRWNILNYGRILNNVRMQEAHLQELIASYQNQVLTAGREVQVPLRGFVKSREQADALARSVTAAFAATDIGVAQYRAGTIDFNRVFNLETTQVQQQDALATAQGNIATNLIAVYRALGGGWELRLQMDPLQMDPSPAHAGPPAHAAIPAPNRVAAVAALPEIPQPPGGSTR
jgi:NodT family efflux transporter outer membrane factor (OMF) lipoprotein